jgi:hypothetical protein
MPKYEPRELSPEEIKTYGVNIRGRELKDGEIRISAKLDFEGGECGYILTIGGAPGWQNSHSHQCKETYIVQRGQVALATCKTLLGLGGLEDYIKIKVYKEGDVFTLLPGEAHNIYTFTGAIIHTVQHGACVKKKDWTASPMLDGITKGLTEEDIYLLAS